jgi:hypothetical protein
VVKNNRAGVNLTKRVQVDDVAGHHIEGLHTSEERTNQNGKEGIIYFSSQRNESELESIQRKAQDAYQKIKEVGK